MKREENIRLQFDIIETYIREHGQGVGTWSWQKALQAVIMLRYNLSLDLHKKENAN